MQARYNQIREDVGRPLVQVHTADIEAVGEVDINADAEYFRDILLVELLQLSKEQVQII